MPPRRNQKDDAAATAAAAAPPPTPQTQGTIRQSVPRYNIEDEDEEEQRDTLYPALRDRSNEPLQDDKRICTINYDDPETPAPAK